MLHYTCDFCDGMVGRQRFDVRVEVMAAHDPGELTEADLDDDHLTTLDDLLNSGSENDIPPRREVLTYHLCPACRDRYRADPLGREAGRRLNFSQN